ncbi:MAG: CatA-like O-acetyltransferase, family 2 [Muribaculaceae bacterium]|nr:CatA-like O-acetyltransferase, family 2 [Muribaculaceae bacterium]
MKEINPQDTARAMAYEMFIDAPMPMVTLLYTLDISRIISIAKRRKLKLNMLLCYCIGLAAEKIPEFKVLVKDKKFYQYDKFAINIILNNCNGGINSCDIPFSADLEKFNSDYLALSQQAARSCTNFNVDDCMIVGTSALASYEIDYAINMYSGIFNNPFLAWSRYKKSWFKTTLKISLQFHHVQMDGSHASHFLHELQKIISNF